MTKDIKKYIFWRSNKDWYTGDPYNPLSAKLTELAPPEAVESYNLWINRIDL